LKWDPVDANDFVTKILIYRSTTNYPQESDTSSLIATLTDLNQLSYRDTDVSNNTTYYYSVFTVNDEDTLSDPAIVSVNYRTSAGGGGGSSGGGNTGTVTTFTPYAKPTVTPQTQTSSIPLPQSAPLTTTPRTVTGPFSIGIRSEQVKVLQSMLSSDKSIYPEGDVTGFYGPATTRAVKRFQKKYGIEETGLAGIQTRTKLNQVYGQTTSTPNTSSAQPQTTSSSSPGLSLRQLVELLISLGVISPDKANLARTALHARGR
jgi:peptidoglycan hydrolase-like protein with peptidoglycan-binding domain